MTTFINLDSNIDFPDSDGKPMADNTEQFRWIVLIKENLKIMFAAFTDIFVAGDLLWYPVNDKNVSPSAPDAMVIFGVQKKKRGSYQQWKENNITPQVVFEIRSPGNKDKEMEQKLEFYNTYGVEEYYLYNPDNNLLEGWVRQNSHLVKIQLLNGWVSPRLGIRFDTTQPELEIYRPDGDHAKRAAHRFLSFIELRQLKDQESQRADMESQRAEIEKQRADMESQRADMEKQRADMESQRAEVEKQRAEQMAAYLKSLGIEPDNLASM
jgi:Uma2 family endonuclease